MQTKKYYFVFIPVVDMMQYNINCFSSKAFKI